MVPPSPPQRRRTYEFGVEEGGLFFSCVLPRRCFGKAAANDAILALLFNGLAFFKFAPRFFFSTSYFLCRLSSSLSPGPAIFRNNLTLTWIFSF